MRPTVDRPGLVHLLVASAVMAAVAPVALVTGPAHASTTPSLSTFDSRLLRDINHARTSRGIRALTLVAGTTDVAHGWSCHQASRLTLVHNPNLAYALTHHGSAGWTTYGENVGVQSSVSGADHLFRLYMDSPGHRANILDRSFRYVGLWSKRGGGLRWSTVDFVGKPVSSYNYGYGSTRRTC